MYDILENEKNNKAHVLYYDEVQSILERKQKQIEYEADDTSRMKKNHTRDLVDIIEDNVKEYNQNMKNQNENSAQGALDNLHDNLFFLFSNEERLKEEQERERKEKEKDENVIGEIFLTEERVEKNKIKQTHKNVNFVDLKDRVESPQDDSSSAISDPDNTIDRGVMLDLNRNETLISEMGMKYLSEQDCFKKIPSLNPNSSVNFEFKEIPSLHLRENNVKSVVNFWDPIFHSNLNLSATSSVGECKINRHLVGGKSDVVINVKSTFHRYKVSIAYDILVLRRTKYALQKVWDYFKGILEISNRKIFLSIQVSKHFSKKFHFKRLKAHYKSRKLWFSKSSRIVRENALMYIHKKSFKIWKDLIKIYTIRRIVIFNRKKFYFKYFFYYSKLRYFFSFFNFISIKFLFIFSYLFD